jgi:hypothetical protein
MDRGQLIAASGKMLSKRRRSVLALGLLITLCVSADAEPVHRSKRPAAHLRPGQGVTVPKGYAVPGWTDEETRKWLYNGSAASGLG